MTNRLEALYEKDDQDFRDALIAQESTTDSRVDAMRTRVAELKAKREAERQKIVEEKLLQKWRCVYNWYFTQTITEQNVMNYEEPIP